MPATYYPPHSSQLYQQPPYQYPPHSNHPFYQKMAANTPGNDAKSPNASSAAKPIGENLMSSFSVFNLHGLKPNTVPSKVPYIADRLTETNQLFMCITETWLKDHKDAELYIDGYTLFRADRKRRNKGGRGRLSGGAAAYVRDDIASAMEHQI